ncbi:hypothetical protein F5884DRAFT_552161 [Xylogone sp. PMI_703]|nr:hypothetical protein F5884DRAFT_552161 [Xylogone sp. PMI_703]
MAANKSGADNARHVQSNLADLFNEVRRDIFSQAGRIGPDMRILHGATEAALAGGIVDDRKYLVENIIQLATSLPNGSRVRDDLNAAFISRLWDNLRHPPLSYLGNEFRYRTADGSNNNILYPHLGAAGSHYARSVVPKHKPTSIRPDPSLIFDSQSLFPSKF